MSALIDSIAPAHKRFDERAVHFGHRYRSGFWAIYSLSALAVLFAFLPLALGWDSPAHALHPLAGLWAVSEVGVIAIVIAIYWRGQRSDWQGEWLRTRTTAELTWYLPLLAPLVDFDSAREANWYVRAFDTGQHPGANDEVTALCSRNETLARKLLGGAWNDPAFVDEYARWASAIFEDQKRYHHRVASRQHALLHRAHRITGTLFVLTAVAALAHLAVHTLWLSLITTFFPALGASLHGALAQSEAYRLSATAERLEGELQLGVARIHASLALPPGDERTDAVRACVKDSLALILEEHQDWQMLVRPHHLPLA